MEVPGNNRFWYLSINLRHPCVEYSTVYSTQNPLAHGQPEEAQSAFISDPTCQQPPVVFFSRPRSVGPGWIGIAKCFEGFILSHRPLAGYGYGYGFGLGPTTPIESPPAAIPPAARRRPAAPPPPPRPPPPGKEWTLLALG